MTTETKPQDLTEKIEDCITSIVIKKSEGITFDGLKVALEKSSYSFDTVADYDMLKRKVEELVENGTLYTEMIPEIPEMPLAHMERRYFCNENYDNGEKNGK